MHNWSEQLQGIGFEKTKQADGTVSHCYQAAHRRSSFWTQITVKQVGRPNPDSWQVTYARSEIQIGLWKIHKVVKSMEVIVHTCLLYTSPSPRDRTRSRMPSSA